MVLAQPESRLQARDLCLGYGAQAVLEGVDLDVLEGELTVILGPNACGKSTLLKALSRVLIPQGGRVLLDQELMQSLKSKDIARVLAMLPQTPDIPAGATVADIVARGRYPHQGFLKTWSAQDQEICTQAMASAQVLDLAERSIEELSGGQRQRVWIAMTLAQQTPLVLLDEPTTYLDITHQIEVLNLTRELYRQGSTVVVVLHDLNLAFRYATHVVLMRSGKILAQGDPRQIVTESLIKEVYGLDSLVIEDPCSGTPLVIPTFSQGA
ncbi:ABC transporter ATP-binding protein [Rothia sp. CCM 9416]|uniref:ABC transporter ATP-binding protein n=1 Tax=Rothia sp. CCM 9416 TaxID=3402655 RepID=UPI003AE69A73